MQRTIYAAAAAVSLSSSVDGSGGNRHSGGPTPPSRRRTFATAGCQAATRYLQQRRHTQGSPFLSRRLELVTMGDDGTIATPVRRDPHGKGTVASHGGVYCCGEQPTVQQLRPRVGAGYRVEDIPLATSNADGVGTDSSITIASHAAAYARRTQYATVEELFDLVVDRGFVDPRRLVYHQDGPPPAVLLENLLQHCTPSCALVTEALIAVVHYPQVEPRFTHDSSQALQRIIAILRHQCPVLYARPSVRVLLIQAALHKRLFADVVSILAETEDDWITAGLWAQLVVAGSQGNLGDASLLHRLLQIHADEESRSLSAAGSVPQPASTPRPDGPLDEVYAHEHGRAAPVLSTEGIAAPLSSLGVRSAASVLSSSVLATSRGRPNTSKFISSSGEVVASGTVAPHEATREASTQQPFWAMLSTTEVGYSLEHYQGLSAALGDHRGGDALFGDGNQRLYTSAQGYIDDVRLNDAGHSAAEWMPPGSLRERWGGAAVILQAHGAAFGLDATTAVQLMLRVGVSFRGQASPLLALHVLRRYVRTCRILKAEALHVHAQLEAELRALREWTSPRPDRDSRGTAQREVKGQSLENRVATLQKRHTAALQAAALDPNPFLTFFTILREARDVLSHGDTEGNAMVQRVPGATVLSLPMMHWELAWHYLQLLNRENPGWYTMLPPEQAGNLCKVVLELMMRGAEPWMCLGIARQSARRHIVDGLEVSLWLMHHVDPSHHTEEMKDVARQLFRWLLADVGLHLHPKLHRHLIPVTRVLIRVGLQSELTTFYNAVLDNAYTFSEAFRVEFMQVTADLVCPSCSAILAETDIYRDRTCANCLRVVLGKDANSIPSFQLSAQHMERIREKRKGQRRKDRARMYSHFANMSSPRRGHPPMDAVTLLKQKVLSDPPPLLPGVRVSRDCDLYPVEGSATVLDLRSALEESSRRLAMQRAARANALAQRRLGSSSETGQESEPTAAVPSSSLLSSMADMPCTAPSANRGGAAVVVVMDGAWSCVWCQESNSRWCSRVRCGACGAETGPAAPWRRFAYAADGDVMGEVRARIANCGERAVDAVVAAYLLMVYRRSFLLKATPHDHERILKLLTKLCLLHERVLAAYTYSRLVPPPMRRKDSTLLLLAQLFGGVEAYHALTDADLLDDDRVFQAVFSPATCKVCFATHEWTRCPIVTRDFTSAQAASINLTPEEKKQAVLHHLHQAVAKALEYGKTNAMLVMEAYAQFVASPFRELFAEVHAADTNALSMILSDCQQYRRASFVLCHVPLARRRNEAYIKLVGYYDVAEEEAMQLLATRKELSRDSEEGHPNFVQVTRTCCMCLDERHASFACPRLYQWLQNMQCLSTSPLTTDHHHNGGGSALIHPGNEASSFRRLQSQADGWTAAGPERLHAFYRFLLEHVDRLRDDGDPSRRRVQPSDPFVYALNHTIVKLCTTGKRSHAYRLYARSPIAYVSQAATTAMLRLNSFSEDGIRTLLQASSESVATPDETALVPCGAVARAAAVPLRQCCLLCFASSHAFCDCPELMAQPGLAEKLCYVMHQVGGIACATDGIRGAAAYVYHTYNKGLLTNEFLRGQPQVVASMIQLATRCFGAKLLSSGVRLLRRLPLEMVPPGDIYPLLWRAAGLSDDAVEARHRQLLALYDAEGLVPSVTNLPPRQTYSARFMGGLSHALHDDLCRHCYEHGHTITACSVFQAEVSFGRDYVAAYRMSMMSEQLDREWQDAYLLKLVDFFTSHQMFMPYHIAGVANALNAIAAMLSFCGEPGIALQHLLMIPPAYRRRPAFKHILHALQVPPVEVARVLSDYYFSADDTHKGGKNDVVIAQHLLMPKPAIRDVAMRMVFDGYPAAHEALAQAEERRKRIRERHQPPPPQGRGVLEVLSRLNGPRTAAQSTTLTNLPVMQSGDIFTTREAFDPILSELEDAVGMKLGSRHILFTSAVDILTGATSSTTVTPPGTPPPPRQQDPSTSNTVVRDAEVVRETTKPSAASPRTPHHWEPPAPHLSTSHQEARDSRRNQSPPRRGADNRRRNHRANRRN